MSALWIVVASLGVLTLFNLLLTFAVLRRLKEHSAALGHAVASPSAFRDELVGTRAPTFRATAVDGSTVDSADLARPLLVGFFSAGCEPCHDQAPVFARWAGVGGGPSRVLAVVTGDGPDAADLAETLTGRATVVVEPDAGAVAATFGVAAFPTFLRIDGDDVVVGSDVTVDRVVSVAAELSRP